MTVTDAINLVSALVWPVVIVLLVLLFRDPIKNLLGRLKSFETAGFKGEFNAPAEEALGKAEAIAVPKMHDPATQALINQTVSQPWWAVHQAWRSVRWAAEMATPEMRGRGVTTVDRVSSLFRKGLVHDEIFQLTLTLRGLYYDIKGKPDALTSTAAADFVEAASTLAQALRGASGDSNGASESWPADASQDSSSPGGSSSTGGSDLSGSGSSGPTRHSTPDAPLPPPAAQRFTSDEVGEFAT